MDAVSTYPYRQGGIHGKAVFDRCRCHRNRTWIPLSNKAVHQIAYLGVNDLLDIPTNDVQLASCINRRAEGTVRYDTNLFASAGRIGLEDEFCYIHVLRSSETTGTVEKWTINRWRRRKAGNRCESRNEKAKHTEGEIRLHRMGGKGDEGVSCWD